MRCVCLLLQDLTSGIQMDDCVLVDFGLWRTYFAEPQSSTGAINRFKEMTAAHVGCQRFPYKLFPIRNPFEWKYAKGNNTYRRW